MGVGSLGFSQPGSLLPVCPLLPVPPRYEEYQWHTPATVPSFAWLMVSPPIMSQKKTLPPLNRFLLDVCSQQEKKKANSCWTRLDSIYLKMVSEMQGSFPYLCSPSSLQHLPIPESGQEEGLIPQLPFLVRILLPRANRENHPHFWKGQSRNKSRQSPLDPIHYLHE